MLAAVPGAVELGAVGQSSGVVDNNRLKIEIMPQAKKTSGDHHYQSHLMLRDPRSNVAGANVCTIKTAGRI